MKTKQIPRVRDIEAAAPELYEALRQIVWKVDQTSGYRNMRTDAVLHMARAALAKADGKEGI